MNSKSDTERTLALIKPDGVYNNWEVPIIERYRSVDLTVVAQSRRRWTQTQAKQFYAEHAGRPFFAGLVLSMSSDTTLALLLEGKRAVVMVRCLNGATDPNQAEPGSIRADFKSAGGPFNVVHGSDSPEAAQREIALISEWDHFFKNDAAK